MTAILLRATQARKEEGGAAECRTCKSASKPRYWTGEQTSLLDIGQQP